MQRLHVDWTRCDGHGLCAELLPEILGRDEWGYPMPRTGDRDPEVPARLVEHARHAVDACPLLALKLVRGPVAAPAAARATPARRR